MNLSNFNYIYPPELIAQYPLDKRDASRMMVVDRQQQTIEHHYFCDLVNFFKEGDVLVLNNSKVFPCRLLSYKPTGGKIEIFLIKPVEDNSPYPPLNLRGGESPKGARGSYKIWECLITDSKKISNHTQLVFGEHLTGEALGEGGDLTRKIRLKYEGSLEEILQQVGHVPLPRYIKREDEPQDIQCYQTIFAKQSGSVAAPTAGFHFTEEILDQLRKRGVQIVFVTLHVGIGTFLPIRAEQVEDHQMQGEYYDIPQETADVIEQAKKEGRRITVVGTTSVRALESACDEKGIIKSGKGYTEKFIYPPYQFKIVDRLLTNFHQPCSTLLILVSAFAGRELVLHAYEKAILEKYRLFSYGDCMLIL